MKAAEVSRLSDPACSKQLNGKTKQEDTCKQLQPRDAVHAYLMLGPQSFHVKGFSQFVQPTVQVATELHQVLDVIYVGEIDLHNQGWCFR